jgi:hypothetical protein
MAYIGKQPVVGNFQVCDAISVVNGQAAYTMQVASTNVEPENANHMLVSLNGILQKPGSSFTISGSTITFASNLATGDVIDFIILLGNVLDIGTPSDNGVTTASIAANAVTAAKLNADIISGQTALATAPADTDEFLVSDAGVLKRLDYSLIKGGGKVGQVVQTTKTDTTSTTSTSFEDISGMSVAITPSATSSKILVMAALSLSAQTSIVYKVIRDSTDIFRGDANSNRARGIAGGTSMDDGMLDSFHYCYLDSPSSTSELTYKAQWLVQNNTGYLNRAVTFSDLSYYVVGASSITAMEILA